MFIRKGAKTRSVNRPPFIKQLWRNQQCPQPNFSNLP